jgi:hypothetical protein
VPLDDEHLYYTIEKTKQKEELNLLNNTLHVLRANTNELDMTEWRSVQEASRANDGYRACVYHQKNDRISDSTCKTLKQHLDLFTERSHTLYRLKNENLKTEEQLKRKLKELELLQKPSETLR